MSRIYLCHASVFALWIAIPDPFSQSRNPGLVNL